MKQQDAVKHDAGKAPWHLMPFDSLGHIVDVLRHGEATYGARNWERGMHWSRPFGATLRHMTAWWMGQEKDPDSGLPHLAHAATSLLFLLAYQGRAVGTDDRGIVSEGHPK